MKKIHQFSDKKCGLAPQEKRSDIKDTCKYAEAEDKEGVGGHEQTKAIGINKEPRRETPCRLVSRM